MKTNDELEPSCRLGMGGGCRGICLLWFLVQRPPRALSSLPSGPRGEGSVHILSGNVSLAAQTVTYLFLGTPSWPEQFWGPWGGSSVVTGFGPGAPASWDPGLSPLPA